MTGISRPVCPRCDTFLVSSTEYSKVILNYLLLAVATSIFPLMSGVLCFVIRDLGYDLLSTVVAIVLGIRYMVGMLLVWKVIRDKRHTWRCPRCRSVSTPADFAAASPAVAG